jgi:hypothetical protein
MKMSESNAVLQPFVESAKTKGASDEFLSRLLIRNGWAASDVYDALGQYWERTTGIAVPTRAGSGESAREAFLYLLSFATLATWATSLGGLIFDLINAWLPDAVSRANTMDLRGMLTWEMARLLVAFPIYLVVTAFATKEAVKYPDRLQSGVRKWLTYIALLGTAGAMICDLIWFLNYLLSGEITPRFLLKSGTVMVLCGGIFAYYVGALRWSRAVNVTRARVRNRVFAIASSLVVLAAFCTALSIAGTPAQQRTVEADRVRLENLRQIAEAVRAWHIHAALTNPQATVPATLSQPITAGNLRRDSAVDPLTGAPYEYRPIGNSRYQICANFSAAEIAERNFRMHSEFWQYGQGETCFVLDAQEEVPR